MLRCKKEEGTSLASLFFAKLQILARDDLCVESEGVLLDLVLRWTEDKVRGNISACGGLAIVSFHSLILWSKYYDSTIIMMAP